MKNQERTVYLLITIFLLISLFVTYVTTSDERFFAVVMVVSATISYGAYWVARRWKKKQNNTEDGSNPRPGNS